MQRCLQARQIDIAEALQSLEQRADRALEIVSRAARTSAAYGAASASSVGRSRARCARVEIGRRNRRVFDAAAPELRFHEHGE